MKKLLSICITVVILFYSCDPPNKYYDPNYPTVKLLTSISDSAETIHLGDTLKLTLVVPDTLNVISKIDGSVSKVFVSNLQSCVYGFTFYQIDTATKRGLRIKDAAHTFVTGGGNMPYEGSIHISPGNKPFKATLNIIPPAKGLYYVEFGHQETEIKVNNNLDAGLRVNINAANKHWYLMDPYYPGFSTSIFTEYEVQGYGYYCFKVE